ncbi:SOS response-associated peptidase [Phenylobacterium sp.]|jgi:putative SOS response-associated peptidase YedK|uniref:SOS response-associated peptidase n=1 Tax=Phenylobacterium sp. TaxID=1871053 RepID=UPI002F40E0D2
MCNLYSIATSAAEIARATRADVGSFHNQPPNTGVYPDNNAPVIVHDGVGGRRLDYLRWGMPSSSQAIFQAASKRADRLRAKGKAFDFNELLKNEPDRGTTNVRNTTSKATGKVNAHWGRWLGPANRCLVPFTSFAEPDQDHEGTRQNIWFALDESRPMAYFAGTWTPHACVRMISNGWEELSVFAFLTTDSAEPVKTYHAKAMPVILTTEAECDAWMSDKPWSEVAHLQRPLPDCLKIVNRRVKQDEAAPA